MLNLRFSSKADIVIESAEFEPGFDVFPGFGKPAQVFGKARKCFGVVAQVKPKASGRALSQMNSAFHSPPVSTTMKTLNKVKLNAGQRSAELLHCAACSKQAEINGD
jgi:hypothetical protein